MAITQNFIIWFTHKFVLHIYKLRCTCSANFVKIHTAVFEILRTEDFLPQIFKKSIKWTILKFKKKSKNILAILFLYILHMPSLKKLALIATEISSKTSAETADTATDPKTIPPAVFQKQVGGKNQYL